MRRRHELAEVEWERLRPLLPARQAGKRRQDDRRIIDGILWKLSTGAPWRDLPERYGSRQTVYTRVRRWAAGGVWEQIFAAVQQQADGDGQLDWTVHCVDGTAVRAHQHAAGTKGGSGA
jgi:transposase